MRKRLFIVGLAAAVFAGSAGAGAGAAEAERPPGAWNIVAEARGVSPYAETPSEQSGAALSIQPGAQLMRPVSVEP